MYLYVSLLCLNIFIFIFIFIFRLRNYLLKEFPAFVNGDEITLPLSKEAFLTYLGFITYFRDSDGKAKSKYSLKSFESVNGEVAGIKSLYAKKEQPFPEDIDEKIKAHLKGLKRAIASFKSSGHYKQDTGKAPANISVYTALMRHSLVDESDDSSQQCSSHLFLAFLWNLMARANSISMLCFEHLSWENDSLLIFMPKQKGDQDGSRAFGRHVFANPNDPVLCPILALGLHVFSNIGRREDGSRMIFDSTSNGDADENEGAALYGSDDEEGGRGGRARGGRGRGRGGRGRGRGRGRGGRGGKGGGGASTSGRGRRDGGEDSDDDSDIDEDARQTFAELTGFSNCKK